MELMRSTGRGEGKTEEAGHSPLQEWPLRYGRRKPLYYCSDTGTILSDENTVKGQATRPISTAQLHTLPCVHLQPINVVVSDGSVGIAPGSVHLEVGFPLRCLQRLS